MGMGLWSLLEAALLVVNAVCVLHEKRFLAKGRVETEKSMSSFANSNSLDGQLDGPMTILEALESNPESKHKFSTSFIPPELLWEVGKRKN